MNPVHVILPNKFTSVLSHRSICIFVIITHILEICNCYGGESEV